MQNWIKCSDRMPESLTPVLIFTGYMEVAYWDEDIEMWGWSGERWCMSAITHWQPLPEPPQD